MVIFFEFCHVKVGLMFNRNIFADCKKLANTRDTLLYRSLIREFYLTEDLSVSKIDDDCSYSELLFLIGVFGNSSCIVTLPDKFILIVKLVEIVINTKHSYF
jgi:hypothetical protein